jgi:hypothetical protein
VRAALEAVVEAFAVVLEAMGLATLTSQALGQLGAPLVRGGHGCCHGVGESLETLSTRIVGHDIDAHLIGWRLELPVEEDGSMLMVRW